MKRIIILFLLPIQLVIGQNNDTISLLSCYEEALANYPLARNKNLLEVINQQEIKNIRDAYYPSLDLNGQVTYQSDVPKIDIPIPNVSIPEPAKDQYKLTLDINQIIYDGGMINSMEELENARFQTDIRQLEVDLYMLRERINLLYFSILLLQEKEEILELMIEEINTRIGVMKSGVENGMLRQTDIDNLFAERLKIEQQLIQIQMSKIASSRMLGELIGKDVSENPVLKVPVILDSLSQNITRPEYDLFEAQVSTIDISSDMVSKQRRPRMYGFGSLGYGRPGLNMLSKDFDSFYIVGARISWKILDWNHSKREHQILSVKKDVIQTRKETFDKNIMISLQNELTTIQKLEELINKDIEIIRIRENITKTSASQVENGVITSTDYLSDLNSKIQAKINLESHKIELIQSKINYLTLTGGY